MKVNKRNSVKRLKIDKKKLVFYLSRSALYLLGLTPAAFLLWQGIEGRLGADPVNIFERSLGLWAFRFLTLCLAITPLYQKTGINFLSYRRLTGLLAFFYATFHFIAYFGLEAGFKGTLLIKKTIHYPFMILGMSALIMLLPLALTSNRASMKFLGRYWKKLHWMIFPASLLAGIHFYLSFKLWEEISLFYDSILLLLVVVRVPLWWKKMKRKIG